MTVATTTEPPPPVPLTVERCQILLGQKIRFHTDKWTIRPESYQVLDKVVDTLRARLAWQLRIEGHRDAQARYIRVRVSQRRAQTIRRYLIERGIDPARLIAVGYGDSRPIATNDTAEGRAMNRRIELHIENCKTGVIVE